MREGNGGVTDSQPNGRSSWKKHGGLVLCVAFRWHSEGQAERVCNQMQGPWGRLVGVRAGVGKTVGKGQVTTGQKLGTLGVYIDGRIRETGGR